MAGYALMYWPKSKHRSATTDYGFKTLVAARKAAITVLRTKDLYRAMDIGMSEQYNPFPMVEIYKSTDPHGQLFAKDFAGKVIMTDKGEAIYEIDGKVYDLNKDGTLGRRYL